jgi:glycosyltransferase involved in cell wall biosynthesis
MVSKITLMNILIISEVDWLKKVTYEIHHLSEIFSLKGHNVYAIDIPDPGLFSLKKEIWTNIKNYNRVYADSSVHLLRTPVIPIKGLNRFSAYFTSYRFIKKTLIKNNVDIVLVYSIANNIQATIKACKENNVPIIHRTFDIVHELILEKFLQKKVLKIEHDSYPKFDEVISNTPYMKTWAEKMGGKNVIVIEQGVDSNVMQKLPKDNILMKKLRINLNDQIVMYLGSILSHSGLEVILDSIPNILKEIPNFKLLIVGDGPNLSSLKQQAKKLGISEKIIFTGFVPYKEVPKFCSLANLCINSFRINDMTVKLSPVKIFDFMSCGKPVLATPLKGMLHDFPKYSETIIYEDLNNFEEKIISLLQKECLEEIGDRCRKFVKEYFTWEIVAQKMLDEFEKMKN